MPKRGEQHPFDTWEQLHTLAGAIGERYGPLVLFAAATGLRRGEWIALEQRDIDRAARVLQVRRTYRNGRLKTTKTHHSTRTVPLQHAAINALDRLPSPQRPPTSCLPAPGGGHFDLHNLRNRHWNRPTRSD